MSTADIIVAAVIIAIVLSAAWKIRRNKKNSRGCPGCGGCSAAGSCTTNHLN